MLDGLATASCMVIVGVVSIDAPPPFSPGGSLVLFSLDLGGAASRRLPGIEIIFGRKWSMVSVRVSSIITVQLTGSALMNNLHQLSLNSV